MGPGQICQKINAASKRRVVSKRAGRLWARGQVLSIAIRATAWAVNIATKVGAKLLPKSRGFSHNQLPVILATGISYSSSTFYVLETCLIAPPLAPPHPQPPPPP